MSVQPVSLTISSGQSLSLAMALPGTPVMVTLPPGWTPASVGFQAAADGMNFGVVFNGGNEAVYSVPPSGSLLLDQRLWGGVTAMKIQSGSSEAPVAQGSNVTIIVSCLVP